jgi:glycosyltransferase involved in cell wall biosynthesis
VRVALINEGTYPFTAGGVSTWCDQLVRGLADHQFQLVTITADGGERPVWALPQNVGGPGGGLIAYPIWGRALPAPSRARRAAGEAAVLLGQGMLAQGDDAEDGSARFALGLRVLTEVAESGCHPLAGVDLAGALLEAWPTARAAGRRLPPLTLRDAARAAELIEHAVRPLALTLTGIDLCHPAAGGLPSLIALAAKWRSGTPMVMSEHGVYLRERYLAFGAGFSLGAKAATLAFLRALARLCYREADLIAPVSDFNGRWALRHGADPAKVITVPNGVDGARYEPIDSEPAEPTVTWVGRVDPLKDLETLIRAFRIVRDEIPEARLRLFGPVPVGNEEYAATCRALIAELDLVEAVSFEGPVASSRDAFSAGHVAALSSISEGLPYSILEAMMCGRATVNTDVGGVAEAVADAGILVPPRQPLAFARACISLLQDRGRRMEISTRARQRALARFTVDHCVGTYRALYLDAVDAAAAIAIGVPA